VYKSDENNSLDIFKMVTNIFVKEFVNKKLLIFWTHQMDVKDFKCIWSGGESMFSTIDFLASQILGIVGFQIEIKKIFSLLVYSPIILFGVR
jgi:hypothetical protein